MIFDGGSSDPFIEEMRIRQLLQLEKLKMLPPKTVSAQHVCCNGHPVACGCDAITIEGLDGVVKSLGDALRAELRILQEENATLKAQLTEAQLRPAQEELLEKNT